jgi:DNA-binding beta-propeller fold protein YncE
VLAPIRTPPIFYQPVGVAVDRQGITYVVDPQLGVVEKLSPTGRFLLEWPFSETNPASYAPDTRAVVDQQGNVYVADPMSASITVFSPAGKQIAAWTTGISIPTDRYAPQVPYPIAMDQRDVLYILQCTSGHFADPCASPELRTYDTGGRLLTRRSIHAGRSFNLNTDCPPGLEGCMIGGLDPLAVAIGPHGAIYLSIGVRLDGGRGAWVIVPVLQQYSAAGRLLHEWRVNLPGPPDGYLPPGLAVDRYGNVFLPDIAKHRILSLGPRGRMRAVWGVSGCGLGRFDAPGGIALDQQGNLYVTDTGNENVQKLSPRGTALALWGGCAAKEFSRPSGVAVDTHETVYVADTGHGRVVKLSPSGKVLATWGGFGPNPGTYAGPRGVAVDAAGDIFVADIAHCRIQKLSPQGTVLAQWGGCGSQPGKFSSPMGLAVDAAGAVYVADNANDSASARIQKLSPTGKVLDVWAGRRFDTPHQPFAFNPVAIAVDTQGNIYVSDVHNRRIVKLSPHGALLAQWNTGSITNDLGPAGVAVDAAGNIYLTDSSSDRVEERSPTWQLVATWEGRGVAPGRFNLPWGIAIDTLGNAYVAEAGNNRIQKLTLHG